MPKLILPPQEQLTTAEAAEILNVGVRQVVYLCNQGLIGTRFGGAWAIGKDDLAEFALKPRPVGRRPAK